MLPVITKQFHKLREVNRSTKHILHAALVKMEAISCQLKSCIRQTRLQIAQKGERGFARALADYKRRHQLSFRIHRHKHPLVTEFDRVILANVAPFLANEAPDFIALNVPGEDPANSHVQHAPCIRGCRGHQAKNRSLVQASDAGDGANAHSLQHQGEGIGCGLRIGVVCAELRNRLAEGSFAGCAAPALNAALAEITEPPCGSVFASGAGHGFSPLAFCEEKPENQLWSRSWLTPRFGLAPTPVQAEAGALIYYS